MSLAQKRIFVLIWVETLKNRHILQISGIVNSTLLNSFKLIWKNVTPTTLTLVKIKNWKCAIFCSNWQFKENLALFFWQLKVKGWWDEMFYKCWTMNELRDVVWRIALLLHCKSFTIDVVPKGNLSILKKLQQIVSITSSF